MCYSSSSIVISLCVVKVILFLILFPVVATGEHFVGPWFRLPLLIRVLLKVRVIHLFIAWITKLTVSFTGSIVVRKTFILSLLLLFLELCLIVLFIVNVHKAWESLIWGDTTFTFKDVDHDAVGSLLDSLESESGFLGQPSLICDIGFICQIIDAVKELASLSIHAVALMLVLAAQLCFVVRWQVLFRHKLIHVVGIRAGVSIFTVLIHDNIPAHLGLLHLLDFLVKLESLLLVHELLLLGRPCGLTSEARHFILVVVLLVG